MDKQAMLDDAYCKGIVEAFVKYGAPIDDGIAALRKNQAVSPFHERLIRQHGVVPEIPADGSQLNLNKFIQKAQMASLSSPAATTPAATTPAATTPPAATPPAATPPAATPPAATPPAATPPAATPATNPVDTGTSTGITAGGKPWKRPT